jgi:hypothetical protein
MSAPEIVEKPAVSTPAEKGSPTPTLTGDAPGPSKSDALAKRPSVEEVVLTEKPQGAKFGLIILWVSFGRIFCAERGQRPLPRHVLVLSGHLHRGSCYP